MSGDEQLQAYHDGELSRLARWRFERRLRRSPALRREQAALARVGDWVRDAHAEAPAPDLWGGIALRLPAADARRAEPAPVRPSGLGWLAIPTAVAATAGLAFVLVTSWLQPAARHGAPGVVRWLDAGTRDVVVLESAPDTTIIWVIDSDATEGAHESV